MDMTTIAYAGDFSRLPQIRAGVPVPGADRALELAKEFESVFIAQMLKHSGLGSVRQTFGGGPGEAAFSDMLTQEYASALTGAGGFGLAEKIFHRMREIEGAPDKL